MATYKSGSETAGRWILNSVSVYHSARFALIIPYSLQSAGFNPKFSVFFCFTFIFSNFERTSLQKRAQSFYFVSWFSMFLSFQGPLRLVLGLASGWPQKSGSVAGGRPPCRSLESIHGKSKGHWDRLPTNNFLNMVIEWWRFHGDIFDGIAWNINMGYWLILVDPF